MRRELTTDSLAIPGSVVTVVFKQSHGKGACFYKPGRCSADHPSNAKLAAHGVSVSISLFSFPVVHDFRRGWSWVSVPPQPLPFYNLRPLWKDLRCPLAPGYHLSGGDTFGSQTGEHLHWVSLDGRKHSHLKVSQYHWQDSPLWL